MVVYLLHVTCLMLSAINVLIVSILKLAQFIHENMQ